MEKPKAGMWKTQGKPDENPEGFPWIVHRKSIGYPWGMEKMLKRNFDVENVWKVLQKRCVALGTGAFGAKNGEKRTLHLVLTSYWKHNIMVLLALQTHEIELMKTLQDLTTWRQAYDHFH